MRNKFFPPGYANGWHAVCNAEDIRNRQVKTVHALGTDMVAFRGDDGKAGVLHAFCPHLGAHLGEGGWVEGNSLVCPFHNWAFEAGGKCTNIPYMRKDINVPERAKTQSYPVREILGQIFIWFHAEPEHADEPLWELTGSEDLEEDIQSGKWYYALMRNMEFEQHSCEMAMNSADQYHFDTLHAPFPIPFIEKFVTGKHRIKAKYEEGLVRGKYVEKKELASITENTDGLYFFGNKRFPVPFSEFAASRVHATVTFEGPSIVHFEIKTPFGDMRQVKTILSIEPYKQYVESRWYAQRTIPRVLVHFFALIGARALEQDRQVWESKIWRHKPMLVPGDGPFPAFMRWYSQFYSDNSTKLCHSLEW